MDRIVQRQSDTDAETLGVRIIELLAKIQDEDVLELPPLNDSIDVEAVEHLLDTVDGSHQSVEVEFEYLGTRVAVDERERIVVESN